MTALDETRLQDDGQGVDGAGIVDFGASSGGPDLLQALTLRSWSSTVDLLGYSLSVEIAPAASPPADVASWLIVDLDGDRCQLGLGPALTAFFSRPFGQLPQHGDPIAALCAAYVLDPALSMLEGAVCERCTIEGWERQAPEDTASVRLTLALSLDDGGPETASLHLSEAAAARVAKAFERPPDDSGGDGSRPMTGWVSLATFLLPKAHLQNLKTGGAILLGRAYVKRHDAVLRIGPHRASCRIGEGGLTILSSVDDMGPPPSPGPAPERKGFEVEIDAVLTRITMTSDDLSGLEPGSTVDLPAHVDQHVTLVADGRPIVHGRVIDVGGALAVELVDWVDGHG